MVLFSLFFFSLFYRLGAFVMRLLESSKNGFLVVAWFLTCHFRGRVISIVLFGSNPCWMFECKMHH